MTTAGSVLQMYAFMIGCTFANTLESQYLGPAGEAGWQAYRSQAAFREGSLGS